MVFIIIASRQRENAEGYLVENIGCGVRDDVQTGSTPVESKLKILRELNLNAQFIICQQFLSHP